MIPSKPAFYEFFAGAGMARAGLGKHWRCLFANDIDRKKASAYRLNWGTDGHLRGDVRDVNAADLPGRADLAWASFPCQDLSLAGCGAGLQGERSGMFWPFQRLILELGRQRRAPTLLVLENVCGTLASREGKDFTAICQALQEGGYRYGALIVDAALFVPQSRPRLFVIAVRQDAAIPGKLVGSGPLGKFHTRALETAWRRLPDAGKENWIWWAAPTPPPRRTCFSDFVEDDPADVAWHAPTETARLLAMMSAGNLEKVRKAMLLGRRIAGTAYKRTRRDAAGRKTQRTEIRFDDVAGCLRTPAGGSSRQIVVVVEGGKVRSRLMSSRETARLMGLPDDYILPDNYNEAYHLTGDGVAAPVVRFLAQEIFEPALAQALQTGERPHEHYPLQAQRSAPKENRGSGRNSENRIAHTRQSRSK